MQALVDFSSKRVQKGRNPVMTSSKMLELAEKYITDEELEAHLIQGLDLVTGQYSSSYGYKIGVKG